MGDFKMNLWTAFREMQAGYIAIAIKRPGTSEDEAVKYATDEINKLTNVELINYLTN
jgi:hypothetical protein|tara:strand:- start:307 stop:477 length:171 start_codon:yes stop_codon:yes gene_type:complete